MKLRTKKTQKKVQSLFFIHTNILRGPKYYHKNNLEWFYSLDDTNGVYITADLLQLNQTTLEQIQKLVAYYDTWSDEWATKIAEEYNNEVADGENAEEGPESIETEEIEGETGEEFGTEEGF